MPPSNTQAWSSRGSTQEHRQSARYTPYNKHYHGKANLQTLTPPSPPPIVYHSRKRRPENPDMQWLFCREDMQHTPTIVSGKSTFLYEQEQRRKGCQFISRCARQLNLGQRVISTACVLFHRFYMRESFSNHNVYDVSGTCLYLATSIEEHRKNRKDLAMVCARIALKKNVSHSELTSFTDKWVSRILKYEFIVLEVCCFDMNITHPYPIVEEAMLFWKLQAKEAKVSFAYINDCLRSTLCLLYQPAVIATAALYCAACTINPNFEKNEIRLQEWLESKKISWNDVTECMSEIISFYKDEVDQRKKIQSSIRNDMSTKNSSKPKPGLQTFSPESIPSNSPNFR